MTSRRVDPIRRRAILDPAQFQQLHAAWQQLRTEIEHTDTLLTRLAARRRALAAQLARHRDQLWPPDRKRHGRRPGADGTVHLPLLPARPTTLWGRRLRAVCLALLRGAGPTTLTELHTQLHQRGYQLASTHPVKALADALRYETLHGRATRTARGTYTATAGPHHGPTPTLHDLTHLDDAA